LHAHSTFSGSKRVNIIADFARITVYGAESGFGVSYSVEVDGISIGTGGLRRRGFGTDFEFDGASIGETISTEKHDTSSTTVIVV
jgi:hypothetical protein